MKISKSVLFYAHKNIPEEKIDQLIKRRMKDAEYELKAVEGQDTENEQAYQICSFHPKTDHFLDMIGFRICQCVDVEVA